MSMRCYRDQIAIEEGAWAQHQFEASQSLPYVSGCYEIARTHLRKLKALPEGAAPELELARANNAYHGARELLIEQLSESTGLSNCRVRSLLER